MTHQERIELINETLDLLDEFIGDDEIHRSAVLSRLKGMETEALKNGRHLRDIKDLKDLEVPRARRAIDMQVLKDLKRPKNAERKYHGASPRSGIGTVAGDRPPRYGDDGPFP